MKTILVFRDTPDDQAKYKRMLNADKFAQILQEFDNLARANSKHEDKKVEWSEVRAKFWELCKEQDVYEFWE